jgi:hypothetical protein
VKLVDNVIAQWQTKPTRIVPRKRFVHHLRWAVHALGLKPRRGIGPVLFTVEAVNVESPGGHSFDCGLKVTGSGMRELHPPFFRVDYS